MSGFFVRLNLQKHMGCSPSALRGVMQRLATLMVETAQEWETDAAAGGEVRDIIGAVDETFLAYIMLVLMDLHRGSILLEAIAEDRSSTT